MSSYSALPRAIHTPKRCRFLLIVCRAVGTDMQFPTSNSREETQSWALADASLTLRNSMKNRYMLASAHVSNSVFCCCCCYFGTVVFIVFAVQFTSWRQGITYVAVGAFIAPATLLQRFVDLLLC